MHTTICILVILDLQLAFKWSTYVTTSCGDTSSEKLGEKNSTKCFLGRPGALNQNRNGPHIENFLGSTNCPKTYHHRERSLLKDVQFGLRGGSPLFAVILRSEATKNPSSPLQYLPPSPAFQAMNPFLPLWVPDPSVSRVGPRTSRLPPTEAVSAAHQVAAAMAEPVAHRAASARQERHSARSPADTPA
jgi:hypothetical protein